MDDAAGARAAGVALVEAFLAAHPEIAVTRLGPHAFGLALPGEVRQRIPVGLRVGADALELSCFLLRGPRRGNAAALHRRLLRKSAAARWVRLVLDSDDDAVIAARLPTGGLSQRLLEELLAEVYLISEGSFEALVHLAYPGVFAPLRRPAPPPLQPPPAAAAGGAGEAGPV